MGVSRSGGEVNARSILLLILTLALLILIYLPTLLTQINGGDDPYMDDVGEIQVALNVWGTIHHTGYPLYTILGNLAVTGLKALGVNAATAPTLYAMAWGLIALSTFYLLVLRLTKHVAIAAVTTLLLGLTRSVWMHNVVSEVYGMSFAFQVILLAIALWSPVNAANVRRRVWLLALVGGLGVAHHRMVIFVAPGLILAVWPGLRVEGRRAFVTLGAALLIGLIGFIPYVYLPARALAHADWVYNDPSTPEGFWHEFTGAEAAFLMHLPVDGQAWVNDVVDTFRIIGTEMTPLFAALGGLALVWALFARQPRFRREMWIAFVSILGYFAFLFALHRVVMPEAVAMPIVIVLTLALAFALDEGYCRLMTRRVLWRYALVGGFALVAVIALVAMQFSFIDHLTHNNTGVDMMALASRTPRDNGKAILMMPWGPRYDAIAFSKFVTKANADLRIVTHKADFGALAAQGNTLYTSKDTFYRFPLAWWDEQIGKAYLSSAADELVAIKREPRIEPAAESDQVMAHGVTRKQFSICKVIRGKNDTGGFYGDIYLTIWWRANSKSDADLSVFVHLIDSYDVVVIQADSSAPVYGWYPTTRWSEGEVVRDDYRLPLFSDTKGVTFGMYEQPTPGQFVNYGTQTVEVGSIDTCR
ncbi:MAG: DUF2723 domain-containing protein [Anaerolineae bacterium]|nr:DUF2723 domain-containing protein [Anaerolineae bacterium]